MTEIEALDKKIETTEKKLLKAKKEYDALLEQMNELLIQRYPERQEAAVKDRLWKAYQKSGKDIETIIDFIENGPDDE